MIKSIFDWITGATNEIGRLGKESQELNEELKVVTEKIDKQQSLADNEQNQINQTFRNPV